MRTFIGEVPDHWRQVCLGEVCDVSAGPSGGMLKADDVSSAQVAGSAGAIPVITPKDLRSGGVFVLPSNVTHAIPPGRLERYRLRPDDIVGVRTGTLGGYALINDEQNGWLYNTSCFRLRLWYAEPHLAKARYLRYYLDHTQVAEWIRRQSSTGNIPSINMATLRDLPVVLPPLAVQDKACEILSALDEKVRIHDQIARTAGRLRDSLLPGLLSGAFTGVDG